MIGIAIGWKYNHKQGIRTKGNKIVAWPASLGPKPTQKELDIIIAEYEQYVADNPELTMEQKIVLVDNAASLPDLKEALKTIIFNI